MDINLICERNSFSIALSFHSIFTGIKINRLEVDSVVRLRNT